MIKKISAIILATFYLLINMGLPISINHCHGTEEMSLSLISETSCSCMTHIDSCCNISDESDHVPSQFIKDKMGCCSHEFKVIFWDSDQQIIFSSKAEFEIKEIILLGLNSIDQIFALEGSIKLNDQFIESPPLVPIPIVVLTQQYIFYG